MINNFIDLIACYTPMFDYVLDFVLMLFFVATVPCILRKIVRG